MLVVLLNRIRARWIIDFSVVCKGPTRANWVGLRAKALSTVAEPIPTWFDGEQLYYSDTSGPSPSCMGEWPFLDAGEYSLSVPPLRTNSAGSMAFFLHHVHGIRGVVKIQFFAQV